MTQSAKHLDFEELNDYVDGRLDAGARLRVAKHLSSCRKCGDSADRLTDVLDLAASVPDEVLPPDGLWHDVRAAIDQRKELVLPVSAEPAGLPQKVIAQPESRRPWWARPAVLAAAALFLMVASSAVTTAVLRGLGGNRPPPPVAQAGAPYAPDSPRILPASFRQAEGEYLRTIQELRSALQAQRSTLRPETIATVENSLTIIDAAIDEARAALLSDPSNRTLVDLLTASYERKLDLLRRAADLGART